MCRLLILTTLVVLFAAACSGGSSERAFTPVSGNSELVPGPNRFAVGVIDKDTLPVLEAPGTSLHFDFSLDGEDKFAQEARFVWAIPDAAGFWVADVNFDQAGRWKAKAVLTRDGKDDDVTIEFTVLPDSETPLIGEAVPPADNPTLATESNIKKISTDDSPDDAFYQMTIREALAANKPFVVTFATPAFCQTQFCGPVLDNVKAVRPAFASDVNFLHIEPYALNDEGKVLAAPDGQGPAVAPSMDAWHLNSEPWVFVVGADGKVVDRFEGPASEEELTGAIEEALS